MLGCETASFLQIAGERESERAIHMEALVSFYSFSSALIVYESRRALVVVKMGDSHKWIAQ